MNELAKFNLNLCFDDYLKLDALSYSKLKSVKDLKHNFNRREDEGDSLTKMFKARDLGSVVDDMLLGDEELDQNYIISKTEPPTANSLKLANVLIHYCYEKGINFEKFEKLNEGNKLVLKLTKANKLWPSYSEEKILERLDDTFWNYLTTKLKVLGGKVIIAPSTWEKANELVYSLKNTKYTKDIFASESSINQFSYTFKLDGRTYKVRLDKVIIDAKNKLIKPYDLKTGDVSALSFGKNFYNNSYYLQGSLYYIAMMHLIEKHLPDYSLDDFRFIYISTKSNNPYPVIYKMSEKWVELGYEGFESRTGVKYKGIKELAEEYDYYMTYKSTSPKEIIEANGELDFPLPY